MLDIVFSEKFIDNMRKYASTPFIIINRDGIIIAATEKERVGVFHEASWRMMQKRRQIAVVEPEEVDMYLGAKPGVDLPILYDNEIVGAIGITGIPKEVEPIVLVAKMTIETMLEYEHYKEKVELDRSQTQRFYHLLLKGSPKEEAELATLAATLGFYSNALRMPILFTLSSTTQLKTILEELGNSGLIGDQDIYFTDDRSRLLVFKYVPLNTNDFFQRYTELAKDFAAQLNTFLSDYRLSANYVVGAAQTRLSHYKYGYEHCDWLAAAPRSSVYIYENLSAYLTSMIPMTTFDGIYNIIDKDFIRTARKLDYVRIIRALRDSNYNLSEASQALYMHKNTLIFRYNKIKQAFHINPIQNTHDRDFMDNLLIYLENLIGADEKRFYPEAEGDHNM